MVNYYNNLKWNWRTKEKPMVALYSDSDQYLFFLHNLENLMQYD